jgi:hypothetical protein
MSKSATCARPYLTCLQEHQRDGAIPTSARFLYYELMQRSVLSKERTGARRADQNMHDALTARPLAARRNPGVGIADGQMERHACAGARNYRQSDRRPI